jgi:hypothetical protein
VTAEAARSAPATAGRPSVGDDGTLARALQADALHRVPVILPHAPWQVEIQGYVRRERVWTGELPEGFGVVPNKVPYQLDGAPHYPELLVVRLLESAGWSAAWRKTWNGLAYWRDLREPIELPDGVASALELISLNAGHSGHWELVAWRGRQLRLLTSRTSGGQLVSAYQAEWLSIARRLGIPVGCFGVIEHRVVRAPRRRRLEHIQQS